MTQTNEPTRDRILALKAILEQQYQRPFTYEEAAQIGRGLLTLFILLATARQRLDHQHDKEYNESQDGGGK